MARPKGTKNNMRSPEEKEKIVLDATKLGVIGAAKKYGIDKRTVRIWVLKYSKGGIESLKSMSGKGNKGRLKKPKNKEEALELENLKLKIEVARLKKGYQVKGVGTKKEFSTIKDLNLKS